ncbi:MAG: S41 family peptidase [Bacteroidota bacterium]
MNLKHRAFFIDAKTPLMLVLAGFIISTSVFSQHKNDPRHNFQYLWELFDQQYGNFQAKDVDWQQLYDARIDNIGPKTTGQQLFDDMASMLDELQDFHVTLQGNMTFKVSGIDPKISIVRPIQAYQTYKESTYGAFSLKVIEEHYLTDELTVRYDNFRSAWLEDSIAYLHFRKFGDIMQTDSFMQEFVQEYASAKAFIIDVRANMGGSDKAGKVIADCFADQRRMYLIAAERTGEKHDEFGPRRYWHLQPTPTRQLKQPVIVLTSRSSISAAENFALAMQTLPHAMILGDTTRGVFADTRTEVLPNGWKVSLPFTYFTNHEGVCLEGMGVVPDQLVKNSKAQIKRGIDNQLGTAIKLIQTASFDQIRDSSTLARVQGPQFIEALEKGLLTDEWETALLSYLDAYEAGEGAHYVLEDELLAIGKKMVALSYPHRARRVLEEVVLLAYPKSESAYFELGKLAKAEGEEHDARKFYHEVLELNPKNKVAKKELKQLNGGSTTPLVLFQKSKQKEGS